ncbi:hypothetical protein C8A05DRAFT_48321 [Staphylotrichum tortipilum]|uniref:Uncharacterized protein n=1 Tax=Staphylotrichum tortipilum TaxID=2831512 RepID=A0AAN6RNX4_9PEZI|nr:hypothetical protein C8A05DRAFT_48321 [Staphylotrichum longicolle]
MHTTTSTTLFLAAVASLTHAEELKASGVPNACKAICGPIVTLTNTCDVNPDTETRRRARALRRRADNEEDAAADDDNTSFNVRSVAALCAACMSQNGKTTDATTAVAGVTVKATKPAFTATSGSSTPTGSSSNSGNGAGGSTPKASSPAGSSAGVMSFDRKAIRLGLAAAVVGAASFLFF